MEKYFLEVLHEGEIINETSLEMLKGGFWNFWEGM